MNIDRRCAGPTATELLTDISTRLPGDAHLRRFSLQQSEVIESPALRGAITHDTSRNEEMFVISAKAADSPRLKPGASPRRDVAGRAPDRHAELFLPESDFDAAAGALTRRLTQVISSKSDPAKPNDCQLIQNQPVRSTGKEPFERVTIRARLRCSWASLAPILHELESSTPLLFVDEMQVWKQSGYRAPGSDAVAAFLDVRFDVHGYLRDRAAPESSALHDDRRARATAFVRARDPFEEAGGRE